MFAVMEQVAETVTEALAVLVSEAVPVVAWAEGREEARQAIIQAIRAVPAKLYNI